MSPTLTETFDTPGTYEWTVPDGVYEVHALLEGGQGEDGSGTDILGGEGGQTDGTIPVTPGETLYLTVGAAGVNAPVNGDSGAGLNGGGWGGEATDIRKGGDTLAERVLVAGAGGGGADDTHDSDRDGGAGGGLEGEDGEGQGGEGGTQTEGGAGSGDAEDGSLGAGGDAEDGSAGSGGGGGGYYGGGGGQGSFGNGGGGAGSGYVDDVVEGGSTTTGGSTGDGEITLEYDGQVDDLEVTGERDTEIDLEWTPVDPDETDGQRVYRDTSPGIDPSTAEEVADLADDVDSYTDAGLDNGTQYVYAIESYANGETSVSNEVSATTTLPDVTSYRLDGSDLQELRAEEIEPQTNAGRYRIRWKRATDDSYPGDNEATIAHDADPLEYVITDVLDGEKYDVGIRSETDDVTGEWHTASEVTKLVGATEIGFEFGDDLFSPLLTWDVNAEFDGSQQIWIRRHDYEYDDPKGELVATVSDTADSLEVDVYPDREYTVTVRAVTQYVYADGEATLESESAGLSQSGAGPRGWHVEIDHPSGQTITPQILDNARLEPRVKDLPRARIPVPRDEAYALEAYEGADMRVYRDGERQPIDELEDVEIEPGRCELVGVGATQLERRVQRDVVQDAAHTLAGELIGEETDYATQIDEPDVEELFDELLREGDTDALLEEHFSPGPADPFTVDDGIPVAQSLHLFQMTGFDDIDETDAGSADDDDDLTAGSGRNIDETGEYIQTFPFTHAFDTAEDDVGIAIRWKGLSDPSDVEITVHDADTDSVLGGVEFDTGGSSFPAAWDFNDTQFGGEWTGGALPAGEYYLRLEGLEDSADGSLIDLIGLFDRRFHVWGDAEDVWDNDLHEPGGHLTGEPGGLWLYPAGESLETDDAQTIYSILTGYGATEWNDTGEQQAVAISNDSGRSWHEAENSETVEADFDALGASLRLRITAGGYSPDGARDDATPRNGYAPQRLESYQLRGDLEDTPLIINDSRDADLKDILTDWAKRSDSLWEARQDGDETVIHWAQAGQRDGDVRDLTMADYSVTKRGTRTLRCTVKGGGRTTRETIEAVIDEPVALEEGDVIPGTETVRDAETDERFEYLRDYTVDNGTGAIEALATGDIEEGQALEVEYDFKVSGSYEADEYDGDPRHDRVETINGLTTERGCELAAKLIVDTTSTPRWEADIEIPAGEHVDGLLEALDVDGIAGEAMSVYDLEIAPDRLELRLGSRKRAEDAIDQIRSTVDATSDRV